jgi:hypothetical protein
MATGDAQDCSSRVIATIPTRWFADSNPIRDAVINGAAYALALIYSILQYAKNQTRIATATDGFVDLISYDFFGSNLPRRTGEMDDPFRQRILSTLLREKATRKGMILALQTLTGRTPVVFEPARPADCIGYNAPSAGYSSGAGRYGSLKLPYQCFVTAFRPTTSGIPVVGGYNAARAAYTRASYNKYSNLSQVVGFVTDADIYAAISATKPEGTICWTSIQN